MPTPLLDNVTTLSVGPAVPGGQIASFSAQASVTGAGAVSATVVIEGSNNSNDWVPISTLSMSGTGRATDGGVAKTLWTQIRARVTAISGTNASVSAAIQTRGPGYGS